MNCLLALLVFAFVAFAWPAQAAIVAIVQPPNPSPDTSEALTRLRGELLSVGLEVATCDRPRARAEAGSDSLTWLEQVAAERNADAIIDTVGDDTLAAVDVWVVKLHPRRFEVTRVAVEADTANPSERLALRAIEALRAGLLEVDWAGRRRSDHPAPVTVPVAVAESLPRPDRWNLEAGAVALMSVDGVGPAVLPMVRTAWAPRPSIALEVALAGLGSRPSVSTAAGRAQVAQQFAVAGAAYRLHPTRRLSPFVAVAVGALHTSVTGQTGGSAEGTTADQWSFLVDGRVGAAVNLFGRFYATLAAHVHAAEPYVAIHVGDTVASSGRPNLLLSLALGAWL